jgi:diacylglycerol kinase family enzyme
MHDGGIAILKVFTLAVLNSDQYGNNAVMAPGASVDDGRFDLVSVRRIGLLRAAGFLWHLRRGTIGQMPELTRLISTRYLIERPAAGPWHVDGEPCPPADRLEITIRPRSLRVMVPSPA